MRNQTGFFSFNVLLVITLVLMMGIWLATSPKIDILKAVKDFPKITIQNTISPNNQQDSKVNKALVIDQKALSKLSVKSVNNNDDLQKIGRDLDLTDLSDIDANIYQLETNVVP